MIRWVASFPKSGNTWVRLFMQAYEAEADFDMNHRRAAYRQDIDRDAWEAVAPVPLDELHPAEFYAIRSAALVHMARRQLGPVCVKTHAANVQINGAALIPPALTERAVYVVRDPRDVAVSFADHLGVAIDDAIDKMADAQRSLIRQGIPQLMSSWSVNVTSWTRGAAFPVLTLRYEDLRRDPVLCFTKMAEFFGFVPEPDRLEAAIEATDLDRLRDEEERRGYRGRSEYQERFFRLGCPGTWRDVLTAEQAQRIEAKHRAAMAAFGYA